MGWRFKRAGFFLRQRAPFRIQRYRCAHCLRSFSTQTFSTHYWLKRPDLLHTLFHGEVGGCAHRQLARQLAVAHSTLQRQLERLGRHCLLFHESLRSEARRHSTREPLVLDGLGAFAGGQYWPVELTHLIGARSYYCHDFVATELRRSGRMTAAQRKRREQYERRLGRPGPRALKKDIRELLEAGLPEGPAVNLRSDEKREYVWALGRLRNHRIAHTTTPAKAPRTPHNPLFAINAHHMFVRHSGANHKRETVAFSKRIQAVIARHAVFQVWSNVTKQASERARDGTPAQRLGVLTHVLSVDEVLARRLFPNHFRLRARVQAYYWGRVRSRFVKNERVPNLKYAF
jgi:transposase-like protein